MAGSLIGALRISLGLDTAAFETGATKAEQQARLLGERIGNALRAPIDAARDLNVAIVALGGTAIVAAAKRALDYVSSLDEVSQQLGVTSKDLQTYRYIASQVGIEQDEMDKGLSKLSVSIGQAAQGVDKPAKAFQQLGVSITDSNGRLLTAGEVIPRISDALSKIHEPAARAAVEVALFGKTGQKLDTLLASGSGAIDAMAKAAADLGIVLSTDQIENADRTADKLSELRQVLEARLASTVADNAGAIYEVASAIEKLIGLLPTAVNYLGRFRAAINIGEGGAQVLLGAVSGDVGRIRSGVGEIESNRAEYGRLKNASKPSSLKALSGSASDYIDRLRPTSGALPVSDSDRAKAKADAEKAARDAKREAAEALRNQRAYDADLGRARSEYLAAQQQLTPNIVEQSALAREQLSIEANARRQSIETNDKYDAAQKARLIAIENDTEATQADLINRRENEALARERLEIAQAGRDNESDVLRAQEGLAKTAAERRAIELRLLDLQEQSEKAQQEAILASHDSTDAEKKIAQSRLNALPAAYGAQRAQVLQNTQGPLEAYADSLTKTAGQAHEAFEQAAVDGLGTLDDKLSSTASKVLRLGGIFGDVANQIIASLVKIAVQQAILKPLAGVIGNALGGGGFKGADVSGINFGADSSGILSDFAGARATGGPVIGGKDYLVGERGPEIFSPSMSGKIIANDDTIGGMSRVMVVPSPYFDVVAASAAEPGIRRMGVQAAAGGAQLAGDRAARARRRSLAGRR